MAATEHDGPVTVRVVDTPVVNAFALPGGQILLFEGLLDFATASEAVAGVWLMKSAMFCTGILWRCSSRMWGRAR